MTEEPKEGKTAQTEAAKAALDIAKELASEGAQVVTLSTGYRATLRPVASSLISQVSDRFPEPQVPTWHNDEKGRDEPNPNDPAYLAAVRESNRKRGIAAIDVMVLFGVELVDGLPDDDSWVGRLQYLEKLGYIDLSEFDLDDPMEREFLFKRYIALGNDDLITVTKMSGVSEEEIDSQMRKFPSP